MDAEKSEDESRKGGSTPSQHRQTDLRLSIPDATHEGPAPNVILATHQRNEPGTVPDDEEKQEDDEKQRKTPSKKNSVDSTATSDGALTANFSGRIPSLAEATDNVGPAPNILLTTTSTSSASSSALKQGGSSTSVLATFNTLFGANTAASSREEDLSSSKRTNTTTDTTTTSDSSDALKREDMVDEGQTRFDNIKQDRFPSLVSEPDEGPTPILLTTVEEKFIAEQIGREDEENKKIIAMTKTGETNPGAIALEGIPRTGGQMKADGGVSVINTTGEEGPFPNFTDTVPYDAIDDPQAASPRPPPPPFAILTSSQASLITTTTTTTSSGGFDGSSASAAAAAAAAAASPVSGDDDRSTTSGKSNSTNNSQFFKHPHRSPAKRPGAVAGGSFPRLLFTGGGSRRQRASPDQNISSKFRSATTALSSATSSEHTPSGIAHSNRFVAGMPAAPAGGAMTMRNPRPGIRHPMRDGVGGLVMTPVEEADSVEGSRLTEKSGDMENQVTEVATLIADAYTPKSKTNPNSANAINAPVVRYDVYQAEMEKQQNLREARDDGNRKCLIALMVVLTIGAIVGITAGVLGGKNNKKVPTFDDRNCSNSDSTSGVFSDRYDALRRIVSMGEEEEMVSIDEMVLEDIDRRGSDQRRALCWLADFDALNLSAVESNAHVLIQRYSMAAVYFSLIEGTESRLKSPVWLNDDHECDWENVVCDDNRDITDLKLNEQDLMGSFPSEIVNFKSLKGLGLYNNDVSGTLPSSLWTLNRLTGLDVENNLLHGTFPTDFSGVPDMKSLLMAGNSFFGTIASALGGLVHLTQLHVSGMSGTIPTEIGLWTKLRSLEVSGIMNGTIPTGMGLLNNLTALKVSGRMNGTIPTEMGLLNKLTALKVSGMMNGTIPTEIGLLTKLTSFDLAWQPLRNTSGSLPDEINELANTRPLSEFRLEGEIPTELGQLTKLTELNISDHRLSGTIPTEIALCTRLEKFDCFNNNLSGSIPSQLGRLFNAEVFYFHGNPNLSGPVPNEICSLGLTIEVDFTEQPCS